MDPITSTFRKLQEAHHRRSEHHPEHYDITREDRMLMTCHVLGTLLARARQSQLDLTLSQLRAYAEHHQMQDWEYALADHLPEPDPIVPDVPVPKRKIFKMEEETRLLDPADFYIAELESVQEQISAVIRLHNAVIEVYRRIVKDYDPSFSAIEERIQNMNLDLLRPDMLREYTLYLNRGYFVGNPENTLPWTKEMAEEIPVAVN